MLGHGDLARFISSTIRQYCTSNTSGIDTGERCDVEGLQRTWIEALFFGRPLLSGDAPLPKFHFAQSQPTAQTIPSRAKLDRFVRQVQPSPEMLAEVRKLDADQVQVFAEQLATVVQFIQRMQGANGDELLFTFIEDLLHQRPAQRSCDGAGGHVCAQQTVHELKELRHAQLKHVYALLETLHSTLSGDHDRFEGIDVKYKSPLSREQWRLLEAGLSEGLNKKLLLETVEAYAEYLNGFPPGQRLVDHLAECPPLAEDDDQVKLFQEKFPQSLLLAHYYHLLRLLQGQR